MRRVAHDGSRWWCPGENHGFDVVVQNGSRRLGAFAAMCITASWSGSSPTEYNDVARMFVLPQWVRSAPPDAGLPSDFRHPDDNKRAVVLEPVKDQGPCKAPRAAGYRGSDFVHWHTAMSPRAGTLLGLELSCPVVPTATVARPALTPTAQNG